MDTQNDIAQPPVGEPCGVNKGTDQLLIYSPLETKNTTLDQTNTELKYVEMLNFILILH